MLSDLLYVVVATVMCCHHLFEFVGHHQHVVGQHVLHSHNLIRAQELGLCVTLPSKGFRPSLGQWTFHLTLFILFDPQLFGRFVLLKLKVLITLNVCCHVLVWGLIWQRLLAGGKMRWLLLDGFWEGAVVLELITVTGSVNSRERLVVPRN